MPSAKKRFYFFSLRLCLVLLGLLSVGCASMQSAHQPSYDFFAEPGNTGDIWFEKVAEWQIRARRDNAQAPEKLLFGPGSEGAAMTPDQIKRSGLLRIKMAGFAAKEKRDLARKINTWSQLQARRHYRIENDRNPAEDHWPTFPQLLASNGDDCDGLDMITYEMLLDFGFSRDRVYRAIVRRGRDRGNHMVTLWFENPEDPWILDATGAMTFNMRHFSEIEGWEPRKVFNETEQFGIMKHAPSKQLAIAHD